MRGNQARVKNADVRHPSSTVVMHRRKSASPVRNVLIHPSSGACDFSVVSSLVVRSVKMEVFSVNYSI